MTIRHVLQHCGSVKDQLCLQAKKNYHPQVHVEECKCSDAGDQQCKKKKETVLTCLRVTKLIINEQDVAART